MFFKTLQRSWQNISRPRFQEKPLDEFHESCLRIARVDLEEILIMGGFDRNAKGMKTVAQALSELVNSLVPAFIQIGLESECAKIIVRKALIESLTILKAPTLESEILLRVNSFTFENMPRRPRRFARRNKVPAAAPTPAQLAF